MNRRKMKKVITVKTKKNRTSIPLIVPPIKKRVTKVVKKQDLIVRRGQEHLVPILDHITDAFVIFDTNFRYLYLNKTAEQIIGKKREELIGKTVIEIFPNAEKHAAYTVLNKAIKTRKPQEYEYFSELAQRWLSLRYYPSSYGVAVYYADITQQKLTEEKKNQSEQNYSRIIELAPDVIYTVGLDGTILSLSPAFQRLTGWKPSEWIGKNFVGIVHPDDVQLAMKKFQQSMKRPVKPFMLRILLKSGSYKIGEFRSRPHVHNNTTVGEIGIARDVTEREFLHNELQKRIRQQEAISDIGQFALKGGSIKKLQQAAVQRLYTVLGMDFAGLFELDEAKQKLIARASIGRTIRLKNDKTVIDVGKNSQSGYTLFTKKPVVVEDVRKEKRFKPSSLQLKRKTISSMSVLITDGKNPYGVLLISSMTKRKFSDHDINFLQSVANIIAIAMQRYISDSRIASSEKRFRSIIENSTDGFRLVDKKGKILYTSPSTRRILGYTTEEYTQLDVFSLVHPDDQQRYKETFNKALKNPGKPVYLMYRMRHKDGSWRWLEGIGKNALSDPEIQAIISNFRDVTERLKVERELRRSRTRLQLAVSVAKLGMWRWDLNTDQIIWNNTACSHFGVLKSMQITGEIFYNLLHPDDRDQTKKIITQAINDHMRYDVVFRTISPMDGRIRWVRSIGQVFYDEKAAPTHFEGITINITKEKESDQRKDEFISMASHELKTPITSLKLFVDILERQIMRYKDEKAEVAVTRIREQIERLREIVSDLLDVSRIQTGKMRLQREIFKLDELIEDTCAGLEGSTGKHHLMFRKDESLEVFGDRFRIYQVLTNLITNAIKYSPHADKVVVRLEAKDDVAYVSVKDYGIGIAKDHQKKIFDKLYQVMERRSKSYSGLGMGLYIAHEIITAHGGKIGVKSIVGKGSTFYFSIPLSDKKKKKKKTKSKSLGSS